MFIIHFSKQGPSCPALPQPFGGLGLGGSCAGDVFSLLSVGYMYMGLFTSGKGGVLATCHQLGALSHTMQLGAWKSRARGRAIVHCTFSHFGTPGLSWIPERRGKWGSGGTARARPGQPDYHLAVLGRWRVHRAQRPGSGQSCWQLTPAKWRGLY